MAVLDVEKLLAPVSPDAPCGENLEYDADYTAMEKAAEGKPEQQYGDKVIPGEEPEWREVRAKSLDLMSRTKDLRVGMYLARSATWTDGLMGLGTAMAVLSGLIEQYWDSVHPQLDPEDGNDPTVRLNTVAALTDPSSMLRAVRDATIVRSRGLGKFSYRDIQVALGELPPPTGAAKVEQSTIDGAFGDCDAEELKATAAAVKQALQSTRKIEKSLGDRVGPTMVPPLDPFTDLLQAMSKLLDQKLAARGISDEAPQAAEEAAPEAAAADGEETDGQPASAAANGRSASASMKLTGDISSREDVIRALDKICDYYKRYEPSSPVPLFLNRAKRLASKSFLEILRDLTPDALNQALAIGGIEATAAAVAGSNGGVDENDV
jgi:type VI secretion system protein ImpA